MDKRPEEFKMKCTHRSKPKGLNVARPGSAPHNFFIEDFSSCGEILSDFIHSTCVEACC